MANVIGSLQRGSCERRWLARILRFETAAIAGLAVFRAMTHLGNATDNGGAAADDERGGNDGD